MIGSVILEWTKKNLCMKISCIRIKWNLQIYLLDQNQDSQISIVLVDCALADYVFSCLHIESTFEIYKIFTYTMNYNSYWSFVNFLFVCDLPKNMLWKH